MKSQRKFKPNAGIFGADLSGSVKSSGSEFSGTVKSASPRKPNKKKRRVKFKAGTELSGSVK